MTLQTKRWPLDELELLLEVGQTSSESAADLVVEGLVLEGGASWVDGSLRLTDALRCPLPPSRLRWILRSASPGKGQTLRLPVYLNEGRGVLVAEVLLALSDGGPSVPSHVASQRGVSIILTNKP